MKDENIIAWDSIMFWGSFMTVFEIEPKDIMNPVLSFFTSVYPLT